MPEDFNWDADEDEVNQDSNSSNKTDNFVRLREHAKSLEQQLKRTTKEAEELRKFKVEQEAVLRKAAVKELFSKVGVNPLYGDFFPSDKEVTPENVAEFARNYGFVPQITGEANTIETFVPFAHGTPPSNRYTYEQYRKLLNENPNEAIKAVAEGRVDGMYENPTFDLPVT